MIRLTTMSVLCLVSTTLFAQKYISSESYIRFFSDAPLEDIEAENTGGRSVFDSEEGSVAFSIPIDQFQFEKSLMQEHFNENYLESDKFPEATFVAKIEDWQPTFGKKNVMVHGDLTIHGVTREVTIEGDISYTEEEVQVEAIFPVVLQDHKIKIPKAVFYNIAEEVEVTVRFTYQPYEAK